MDKLTPGRTVFNPDELERIPDSYLTQINDEWKNIVAAEIERQKTYTVKDVIAAGCSLEPLECLHCGHVGEVTFLQAIGDGQCGMCGEWQIDKE